MTTTVDHHRPDLASPEPPTARDAGAVRRRELAEFLRSRRARITPAQLGLVSGRRRRTPGLRREEVAQVAGVGVTWYTWLEQGRDIRASEQVLDAISTTLRLDPYERAHLFTLAGAPEPKLDSEVRSLSPAIQVMLDQLEPLPASVSNARRDILAFNRAYDRVYEVGHLPFEERNILLRLFTEPAMRERLLGWDELAARLVAQFRAEMAQHVAEPSWKSLVKRLRQASPEFERMWDRHEVRPSENRTKLVLNPEIGVLRLDYTHLWLGPRSGTRLTTYTPADDESREKLHRLMETDPGR